MHSRLVSTWWRPVDVTYWADYANESRGHRRPKIWVKDPSGEIWLRKEPPPPDPSRPTTARRSEPAVEVFALELSKRAGIDAAEARPATWLGQRGVVSRRFHDADEQHHPGAELLGLPEESASTPESRQRRDAAYAAATLDRVRDQLRELEDKHGVSLIAPFARVLAFDAWLGNGDRHSGNWAIVSSPRGWRLAPMYDPAACLGVELTDERRELTGTTDEVVRRYAERCGSGFGGGADGRPGISMVELTQKLAKWPEWDATISELLPIFVDLTQKAEMLLTEIPDSWLSAERKRFAARLLAHRVTLLR